MSRKEKGTASLRFQGRKQSRFGAASLLIGIIAWLVFAAVSIYASGKAGEAEFAVGVISLCDAVFCAVGVWLAVRGFQERDVLYGLSVAGMALNAILFLVYFYLYLLGIAL